MPFFLNLYKKPRERHFGNKFLQCLHFFISNAWINLKISSSVTYSLWYSIIQPESESTHMTAAISSHFTIRRTTPHVYFGLTNRNWCFNFAIKCKLLQYVSQIVGRSMGHDVKHWNMCLTFLSEILATDQLSCNIRSRFPPPFFQEVSQL